MHKCLSAERPLHLNVETEPKSAVYPMGHLCVVLHILIF